MQNNNFPGVVDSLLKGMDTVLSKKTNTIVGIILVAACLIIGYNLFCL